MSDENEENEENIHYISDQGSGEDKPQIENIIKEKSKVFQNESEVVRILLSDHYKKFRMSFYKDNNKKIVFEEIKKQIRNTLNTYRIYLDKEKDQVISEELKELNNLLRAYYKDSFFNNVFFVNYFKDIKEMNKLQKKYISNFPKDEMETLNDIERKVKIIKDLKHYLNTKIDGRIQINFPKDKKCQNDYSELKYNYLIIDEDEFSKMNEKKLLKNLSDNINSNKLRRPLAEYICFNYLPILCKGSCLKEAQVFNDSFEKWIISHINKTKCERCMKIKANLNNIKSQIRSLYLKTCIFSHNINEIMFHPLILFSMSSFDPFYEKALRKKPNKDIEQIVKNNAIPKSFNKGNYKSQVIYNPQSMKSIYNTLLEYSKKVGLYIDCCYKNELKTQPCQIKFQSNDYDYYIHMKKCKYYHNNLERRRIYKIIDNDICKNAIDKGGWIINNEARVECNNGEYCNKFHTRNELFFDERYYRKLYPCTETYFCERGDLCPKKHAIDINIDEIFLPKKNKEELKTILEELRDKDKKIKEKLKTFNIVQCNSCLEYIDGIQHRNMIFFKNCPHKICTKCYDYFQCCPFCELKFIEDKEEKNYIEIKLDYELLKPKKKKSKKNRDEDEDKFSQNNENVHVQNSESYDKDIDPHIEENNSFSNSRDKVDYRSYQNNYSFKRGHRNNYYQHNDYNYNNQRNYNYRGNIRGRGRGRGRGGRRGNEKERNIEVNEPHGPMQNFYGSNNEEDEKRNEGERKIEVNRPHGPMYSFYNLNNEEEDQKNEEFDETRRGKGRVRGSTRRIEDNNFEHYEKREYYNEKEEKDNSDNIQNFAEMEESEKNDDDDDESGNDNNDLSMRREGRRENKKIRGRGGRGEAGGRREIVQSDSDDDNKENEQSEEKSNVKLTHFEDHVDEQSD